MKLLQVLFDIKNKDVDLFNEQLNHEIFEKTIIVDTIQDEFEIFDDVEHYDYIVYTNPNFSISKQLITTTISEMKEKNIKISQFTLRDKYDIEEYEYNLSNYRDVFSTLIIESSLVKNNSLVDTYLNTKMNLFNQDYILVESQYMGKSVRNDDYKENLLYLYMMLMNHVKYQDVLNAFESDLEFTGFIDFAIDNKYFEQNVEKDMQKAYLDTLRKFLKNDRLFQNENYTPYSFFYQLVMKGYDEAALNALVLIKSERYWKEKTAQYLDQPVDLTQDIKQTNAWRQTQKFRDTRIKLKEHLFNFEKNLLKICAKVYKFKNKKEVWLISERINSASDNSYYLYKYIQENRTDLDAYYLIDKKATSAIKKLRKYKNLIYLKSFKHKILMLVADKYITSFTFEETMAPFNQNLYKKIYKKELLNKKVISIQHGMIIHNISPYLSKNCYKVDYITANSKYEKEIIMETLGYNDDEVLITGMARHDNLLETSKMSNEILFMPTWQRGLQNLSQSQFLQTEYYKKLNHFINHPLLYNYLKDNNLTLNVLMHPQFEKYSEQLTGNDENVKFQSTTKVEIPDLIAKSKFLITDFSSVAVDFLFQKKNVVFYQYNKYASHHVPSKQIRYEEIGEVVANLEELFATLNKFKDNQFALLPKYENSYERLYEVKQNIRETIVNKIKEI